ncbi:MAG: S6e family ribosomal protein [Candidatus Diapherotrites archaeon]|nr:S6e family ribosomal protein [Candidatus Diapherotrites archaeon]MDZ4256285.1 S6e family ribosomal protein [archaeon]
MNIVVSDPQARKAYTKKLEQTPFVGKKIGDEVDLSPIGLDGYKGLITGGSDKTGTPMISRFPGTGRKKLLIFPGVGFRKGEKGERRKRPLRGNTIAEDIHQVNIKVTQSGSPSLDELWGKKEEKTEAKE